MYLKDLIISHKVKVRPKKNKQLGQLQQDPKPQAPSLLTNTQYAFRTYLYGAPCFLLCGINVLSEFSG